MSPFAGYNDFADCVSKNRGKRDARAYCGSIMHTVEGKKSASVDNTMPHYGEARDDGSMKINTRRGDVVNTIIHENLHLDNPMMSEEEVQRRSIEIEGSMSMPEMADMLMQTHVEVMSSPMKRVIKHTTASKVVSSIMKQT